MIDISRYTPNLCRVNIFYVHSKPYFNCDQYSDDIWTYWNQKLNSSAKY
jgi:hypothetical protein